MDKRTHLQIYNKVLADHSFVYEILALILSRAPMSVPGGRGQVVTFVQASKEIFL